MCELNLEKKTHQKTHVYYIHHLAIFTLHACPNGRVVCWVYIAKKGFGVFRVQTPAGFLMLYAYTQGKLNHLII